MNLEIRVDELQAGDLWLGTTDNVLVNEVDHETGREVVVPVDYRAASSNDLVTLRLVRINGRILSGDDKGFVGTWSLRPDQLVEVDR